MTNWGVRFAALFGPGTYEITKIFEIKARTGVVVTNSLKVARSSWLVECVQPVTFCISERTVSDVRLRERLPHDKGQIFYGRPTTTVSKEDITAQLFTPHLRPTVTNILEAEVVVRWPTVEFFVQRPEP